MDSNPFQVMAKITLRDTDTAPLLAPITASDRWMLLTIVPRAKGMTDVQALDYAEGLGFVPEMFGEPQ